MKRRRPRSTNSVRKRRLIRLPKVTERTGLSRTTIWREIRKKKFPKSLETSDGTRAWVEDEIDDWIAARIAARDASPSTTG